MSDHFINRKPLPVAAPYMRQHLRSVHSAPEPGSDYRRNRMWDLRDAADLAPGSRLAQTVARMEFALVSCGPRANVPDAFRTGLLAAVPGLRRLAAASVEDAAGADEFVRAALLRAWVCRASFSTHVDLSRWLFVMLRSCIRSCSDQPANEPRRPILAERR